MTSVQALIVHVGRVHPQPVAERGQTVHAHLAGAVGGDLGDAVVHERGDYRWFRVSGGLSRDAGPRALSGLRDWERPAQPLHLHLDGARGGHGGVANQADGAASFQKRAPGELGPGCNQHICEKKRYVSVLVLVYWTAERQQDAGDSRGPERPSTHSF